MYIAKDEWSKSNIIIKPFIYKPFVTEKANEGSMPLLTYSVFVKENVCYNIIDNFLSCRFQKDKRVDFNHFNESIASVDTTSCGDKIIVFSLKDKEDLIANFIRGRYSRFSLNDKERILNFYGSTCVNNYAIGKCPEKGILIDMILFPEKYYISVAKELNVDVNLLINTVELASKPDFTTKEYFEL